MVKLKTKPAIIVCLIASFICFTNLSEADSEKTTSFISLENLRSSGEDWEVSSLDITSDEGHVRLRHDNWLMYFLHWRTLDSTNKDLSISYVQNHLLNFWGPDMPFELTADTGTTMVGEHQAYYAGGTIGGGKIKTRFIVWNCEETNRQFTADCNINLKMGTLESKLQTQFDITSSICCHDNCTSQKNSELPDSYSSRDWKLSFNKPSSWNTLPFETEKWFPQGMSLTNGTLWTLMTDSHRLVELYWAKSIGDEPLSIENLKNHMDKIIIDSVAATDKPGISSYQIDSVYTADGKIWAEGTHTWLENYNGQVLPDSCSFVATLWTKSDYSFLLIASLTHMNDIWGRHIDLTPSRETMYQFITDKVNSAIGDF